MPDLQQLNTRRERAQNVEDEPTEPIKKPKKNNKKKKLIIGIIAGSLALILLTTIIIAKNRNTLVAIPDNLVGKDFDIVERKLEDKGFKVKEKKKNSDKYEENKVMSVRPKEKQKVKKGSTVTVTVSKGAKTFEIEDYTGQDVDDVADALEKEGLVVTKTAEKISKDGNIKENAILNQSIAVGKKAKSGDKITLTYASLATFYPDFVNEGYTKSQVESFCSDNKISCNFTEQASSDKKEGSVIDQSRTAGSELKSNDTLNITIAKTQTYTVKFNSNGGNSVSNQTVNSGETADEPMEPTKKNCTFNGWYLNNTKYTFTKPVKSDITLVANWECEAS